MGSVVDLILGAASLPNPAPIAVSARLDADANHLRLPATIADRLGRMPFGERHIAGVAWPYAGPVSIEAAGRRAFCGAAIGGDEVVLGRLALAALDLAPDGPPVPLRPRVGRPYRTS